MLSSVVRSDCCLPFLPSLLTHELFGPPSTPEEEEGGLRAQAISSLGGMLAEDPTQHEALLQQLRECVGDDSDVVAAQAIQVGGWPTPSPGCSTTDSQGCLLWWVGGGDAAGLCPHGQCEPEPGHARGDS